MKQHSHVLEKIRREVVRAVTRTPHKVFNKLAGRRWPPLGNGDLDEIIAPQISGTLLFSKIQDLVSSDQSICNILEIGASSGDGSTEAFVAGLGQRTGTIYTFEISRARFAKLRERYVDHPQVRPINESSIALDEFATRRKVSNFYHTTKTALNNNPLENVLLWRKTDLDYIREHRIPEDGIARLKAATGIQMFDCVLIDGSEFCAHKELELVYGSRYLILDDICLFKNYENHQQLLKDSSYALIDMDITCRYGFSIYKAVTKKAA